MEQPESTYQTCQLMIKRMQTEVEKKALLQNSAGAACWRNLVQGSGKSQGILIMLRSNRHHMIYNKVLPLVLAAS